MVKFSQHVLWKLFCELELRFRGRATVPVKRRSYTPRLWGKNFFFFSSRIHELLSRLLQSPPRNLWISFPIGWFSNSLSSLIRQLDCERGDQMWWQICLIPLKLIQFKMGNTADYCVTDKDTWIALCTRHKLYTYNLYSYTHEKKKSYNSGPCCVTGALVLQQDEKMIQLCTTKMQGLTDWIIIPNAPVRKDAMLYIFLKCI